MGADDEGNLYVGTNSLDCVEVYDGFTGLKIRDIGKGEVLLPNDLEFDRARNLYVVDSHKNAVCVFGPDGEMVRCIGEAGDGEVGPG